MSGIVIPIRKDCIFQEKTIFFSFFPSQKKKRKKRERKKKRNPKVSQPHMAHGGPPEHFEGGPAILWLVFFF